MNPVVNILNSLAAILRPTLFWLGVVAAVIFALDWGVRTKRINPFSPLAQFLRKYVDPIIAPMERKIVRAGGMPHSAPWWTLAAVVVGGILLLWILDFVRAQVGYLASAGSRGVGDLIGLLVFWTFGILKLALLVRVLSSWFGLGPYSKWVRWAYALSEPILRPLRQIVPSIGMIDITPLIAYFVLYLVEGLLVGAVIG